MARKISIAAIITLICISLGCQSIDTGESRRLAVRGAGSPYNPSPISTGAGEIDVIDKVEKARQDYKLYLEALVSFYDKAGNNEKYNLAKKELYALNTMTQYYYIDPLGLPNTYSPTTQIMDADLLYEDALLDKQQAEKYSRVFVNKDLYRSANTKFREVIKKYNTSDKIDDAAYMIGEISEYFKDYSQALEYYQVAYKWNSETPWPARFHAARILDKYMHNYAEALPLYREAIEKEGRYDKYREWKNNAEERIKVLEKTVR
jgi:tetratricopeptide (TPR) repeat protein